MRRWMDNGRPTADGATVYSMAISTYVIDHFHGRPAEGVDVHLERRVDATWSRLAARRTDADGAVTDWSPGAPPRPQPGMYRLVYDAAGYFATLGTIAFYPEVVVVFVVFDPDEPCEIPLFLGPYGYATFRGHRLPAGAVPAGHPAAGRSRPGGQAADAPDGQTITAQ